MRRFKTLRATWLVFFLFTSSLLSAQYVKFIDLGPVIAISENTDGKQQMIDIFQITESPYFHDPVAPRFVLTDKQDRWALGIGGYVQAKVEYDFDKILDNVDFYPSDIPITGRPASTQTQLSAASSTLFLKLVGRTNDHGNFILYTAGNWRGNGNTFQLLNAYASFMGFTVGYDLGLFMDPAAVPPTIDYAGPSGMTFYRTTVFRWEYAFDFGLSMGVGVELPDVSGTVNMYESVGAQRFPNVPAYIQYSWAPKSHLRIGGLLRDITYDNLVDNKDREKVGWGAQASAMSSIGSKLSVFGQYTIGEGIGAMFNDISNLSVDIVPKPNSPGEMMLLLMDGWYAGLRYDFAKNMFATATYSQSSLHTKSGYGTANPTQYKRGQYVVGNLFWNATPALRLGIEYLYGRRTNFDRSAYQANRINFSTRFNF